MHDWMSTSESFDSIRPFLDTDRYTYAFMDHRGYGRSRYIPGKNTVDEAVGDAIGLADQLGWGRFDLLGHAMSGQIAQRASLIFPERIRSMIAVSPVCSGGLPLDCDSAALFQSAASNDVGWKMIVKLVTSDRLPQRWYEMKLRQFRSAVDPQAFLRFLDMWTGTDFSSEMLDLETPALVLVGRHDFSAFSEQAIRKTLGRQFSKCELAVLDGAAHYPMAETPPYFVSVIEQFLSKQVQNK